MADQRLPFVDGDDGTWGDILNQYLEKEHYNTGVDDTANGGHKNVTLRPGTASAGTAPLKFTTGTLLSTTEAGAIEFNNGSFYLTSSDSGARKTIAAYDDSSGATGDMYYRSAIGDFIRVAVGSAGQMIVSESSIPTWKTVLDGTSKITVGTLEPTSPSVGDIWMDTLTPAASGISIIDADDDTKIQVEESADEDTIRFDTAGTERAVIDASGNLGIAQSIPTARTHIKGSTSDDTAYAVKIDNSSDAKLLYVQNDGQVQIQNDLDIYGHIDIGPTTDTYQSLTRYFRGGNLIGFVDNNGSNVRFKAYGNDGSGNATNAIQFMNYENIGFEMNENDQLETVGAVSMSTTFQGLVGHNNTSNKQGGTTNEYYHLTSAQHTNLTGFSGAVSLPSTDGDSGQVLKTDGLGAASWQDDLGGTVDYSSVNLDASRQIGSPTTITTLDKAYDYMWSAGLYSGFALTDNGNGTVNVAGGEGTLRTSASSTAPLCLVNVSGASNISLSETATNYIYVNYNSGSPQIEVATSTADFNCLDKCILYRVAREGTEIHYIDMMGNNVDSNRLIRRKDFEIGRIDIGSGAKVSETGSRYLSITAGSFWSVLSRLTSSVFDTSVSDDFDLYYRNGSGGWTKTTGNTQINNTQYDDGTGTLATIGNNKFGTRFVFLCLSETGSHVVVLMGQGEHANQEAAENELVPGDIPPELDAVGVILALVTVQKSGTNLASILNASDTTFNTALPTTHNNLSGLQGGGINDYYHMTSAQYNNLTGFADAVSLPSSDGSANQVLATNGSGAVSFVSQAGVIGAKITNYSPSASQEMTTTYAAIDGSTVAYTPKKSDSVIVYTFDFAYLSDETGNSMSHIKLQSNSGGSWADVSGKKRNLLELVTYPSDFRTIKFSIPSWGTSEASLRLAGRSYSSSLKQIFHQIEEWDGGFSTELVDATVEIQEIWNP